MTTLSLANFALAIPAAIPVPQDPGSDTGAPYPEDPAHRNALKAAERGDKAEAAGHLDEAWKDYQEAERFVPTDRPMAERAAAVRSKLVRQHVEIAEKFALEGHLEKATAELNQALAIDPRDTFLSQRLLEMKSMDDELPPQPKFGAGFPSLKVTPGKKSFNLRGDAKTVYEQVARQFGITASFDPDLPSRTVRFRTDEVDFKTAMSLLAVETGTFYRPLDPTLMFVAANTADKRKQYAMEGEETFPLPSSVSTEDMTELQRVLKDITNSTHIELNTNSRSITMRDTPDKLRLAGQIIQQTERTRGEIMLDIQLLEVDKTTATNIGLTTPFPATGTLLTPQALTMLKAATTAASALTELAAILTGNGTTNLTSFFPVGGGDSTLLVTLGAVAANFSDSFSVVKSGREVLLRAQNGKPATFFVGDRYPITLSLLSGSLTGGTNTTPNIGLTGLANFSPTSFPLTQFNVGLNPTALVANFFTSGTLPDLAVVYNNSGTTSFTILQNQDSGNFTTVTPAPITLGANETGQIAIGTGVFRNDGTKFSTAQPDDVVLVNNTSNNISILLGNGDGTFVEAPNSPIAVGKGPTSVVVADFNNDGFLDLAVSNSTDNTITLLRGNGDGTFTQFPASPFALNNTTQTPEAGPVAMVSGFFGNAINQTNETDLAIVNKTSNNVTILLTTVDSNQNVTFNEPAAGPIPVGNTPVAITTGDFNADGIADLAVVNQIDNTISVFLGSSNENGTFVAATNSPFSVGATAPTGIVAASFSGGTTPDLAVTNQDSGTLSFFIANGDGTFTAGGLLTQGVQLTVPSGPTAIITGDLSTSNNGLPDVAFIAQASGATNGVVGVILDSSAFAAANSSISGQTPYPGSEFEDLGVKVKATPSLHPNHEVTLQLEFEIRALANATVNGIPILTNRTLSQTVRLKENEPSVLGGLTDVEETRSITGLPGFAEIPGPPGYAFGDHTNSYSDTELLFVITPIALRTPDHNTRAIYAGRGEPGGQSGSGPGGGRQFVPEQPQPAPQPENPPAAPPTDQPQPSQNPRQNPQEPGQPPPSQQPPSQPPPNQPPPAPPTQANPPADTPPADR
ncbi:MAG: FG-GAP-like repeat-containing protein [Candidatus Acidiferrum sp.]